MTENYGKARVPFSFNEHDMGLVPVISFGVHFITCPLSPWAVCKGLLRE